MVTEPHVFFTSLHVPLLSCLHQCLISVGINKVTSCLPVSVTVVDCGSPSTVSTADVVFGSHDNSTLFGSTVYYICREDGENSKSGLFSQKAIAGNVAQAPAVHERARIPDLAVLILLCHP